MSTRRILIVSPSLPSPTWGFGVRVYNLARELARRHRVSLLAYAYDHEAEARLQLGDVFETIWSMLPPDARWDGKRRAQLGSLLLPTPYEVRSWRSARMKETIDRLVAAERFDIVQLESSHLCEMNFGPAPVMILDEHNIEYELLYRLFRKERSLLRKAYNAVEYVKVKRSERSTWRRMDACLVTSDREQHIVQRDAPLTRTQVIPNGVDLEAFQPQDLPPDPHNLVFVGTMNYRPNADAVIYLTREILPEVWKTHPQVTLTVVGQRPPEEVRRLAGPRVIITGWVDDVRPYLRRAAVVLTPVRIGSGTRLKVLEALAMGKALVSTPLGCEGIAVQDGDHVLLADTPVELAQRVVRLLDDPALARRLGRQGRQLVERSYGWRAVVEDLDDLHGELLDSALPQKGHPRQRLSASGRWG